MSTTPDPPPPPPNFFQKLADRVNYAMGAPTNIIIWLLAVGTWIALGPYIAGHSFLPAGSRPTASTSR